MSRLRSSVASLEKADINLVAAPARRYLDKVIEGDEGASLVRASEEFMRAESVRNIPAVCRSLVPRFSRLE